MRRAVYILLTATLFAPVFNAARAETMAERKQRIMRTYLGERQEVIQSDMVLQSESEDEIVLESEKLKGPQVSFEREDSVAMRPPPPSSVRIDTDMERNWLLGAADEEEGGNGDPYNMDSDFQTGYEDSWSQWGTDAEDSNYGESSTASRYDERSRGDPYGYESDRTGYYDSQSQSESDQGVIEYNPEGYRTYSSSPLQGSEYSSGIYGQRMYGVGTESGSSVSGTRRYGPSAPSGLLQKPFTAPRSSSDDPSKSQSPSLTPYKNPYQTMQNPRSQLPGNQNQQPEFKRTTPYQQWKGSNPSWDPTKDDAYLDELMRRNRR